MHENLDREDEIKTPTDRSFGVVFTIVFLFLGIWMAWKGRSEAWVFLVSAALLFVVALARPFILNPFNQAWMKFGLLLSCVVNPVILGVVFFLIISPMAILRKLLGKDSLHLKFNPNTDSYWISRNPPGPKTGSMSRQF